MKAWAPTSAAAGRFVLTYRRIATLTSKNYQALPVQITFSFVSEWRTVFVKSLEIHRIAILYIYDCYKKIYSILFNEKDNPKIHRKEMFATLTKLTEPIC